MPDADPIIPIPPTDEMVKDLTDLIRDQGQISQKQWVAEQLRQGALAVRECVEVDPLRLGGVPVLSGTRFPAAQVLSQLAEGDSVEDLAENFDIDRDLLVKFLHALAACLNRPYV